MTSNRNDRLRARHIVSLWLALTVCILVLWGTDAIAGTTVRVSVDSAGVQGDIRSVPRDVSADGRFVSFDSGSTNLVPGHTNVMTDTFVHDRQTGVTERVSVNSAECGRGTGVQIDL